MTPHEFHRLERCTLDKCFYRENGQGPFCGRPESEHCLRDIFCTDAKHSIYCPQRPGGRVTSVEGFVDALMELRHEDSLRRGEVPR